MSLHFEYNDEQMNETFDEEDELNAQNSLIFVVDGTQQMHKTGYFTQCLQSYRNIVRRKCSKNRQDKMGLFIIGTKETNCGIDNIMEIEGFKPITIDTLKNIHSILKDGDSKFKELASDGKYPLYDALAHVFQITQSVKSNSKVHNNILLCTCNDNPISDPLERRRIEHLVATFKDNQTELRVIGLSDFWNGEIFYKELQILSGTFNNDDYRRTDLKDFEQMILNSAKSICRIPWKISPLISVEVALINLISAPKYPSKVKIEKDDNEVLEARNILREENSEEGQSENLKEKKEKKVVMGDNVMYRKTYAGLDIRFKPPECKKIRNLGLEPSIDTLAFVPDKAFTCDPLYHVNSPYFVTCSSSCNENSKAFFMSFVSCCAKKEVKAICKVVTKCTILICMMIPSEDDGGFYMYKMPFYDTVQDLNDQLQDYIYNSEKECPISGEGVHVFKKLMKLSEVEFDPRLFTNPKLEKCIAHIEALALDEKLSSFPKDSTLPPPIKGNGEILKTELCNLFNLSDAETSKKRSNSQEVGGDKRTKLDFKGIAQRKKLHTLTVTNLKEFLQNVGESTRGNKSDMMNRIYNYFQVKI